MIRLGSGVVCVVLLLVGCSASTARNPNAEVWSGTGYFVQARGTDNPSTDVCFGDLIGGGVPTPDYVSGCIGMLVDGIDFEALEPWHLVSMDVVVAEFEARLDPSRQRLSVDSWQRLDDGYVELKPRQVPIPASAECQSSVPRVSDVEEVVSQGLDHVPLAVVLASNDVTEVTAVGVDEDWFELACDAGVVPTVVHDFLSPGP